MSHIKEEKGREKGREGRMGKTRGRETTRKKKRLDYKKRIKDREKEG